MNKADKAIVAGFKGFNSDLKCRGFQFKVGKEYTHSGTISLNWRLIQTPASVSDYICLHELVHLRQMNHSPGFWREVERVCPDYRMAKHWLKEHSGLLR